MLIFPAIVVILCEAKRGSEVCRALRESTSIYREGSSQVVNLFSLALAVVTLQQYPLCKIE